MNPPQELNHEQVLRVRLEVLRREHRDLDEAIAAMTARAGSDQLAMSRLKKRKLVLKDQIARIEDELTPDIIA
ncbi:MAG: putative conserved small protein containing a coiled-coil domain [Rhodobacteraceae bacterium HLUCCA12]|nr:MAG: putative conserved small protein containing a coiled-coil domain [Rhodobacteraceae bacterium HLUCCA12]